MPASIRLLILHFGPWPEWADLFFETARRNSTVNFLVVTDHEPTLPAAANIDVRLTSFAEYINTARDRLQLPFSPPNAYKLCDLRPMFGVLHEADFRGYDFYGWSDTDLLLGDVRAVYTDAILRRYDVLSTHADRISGHFALFRNTTSNRTMYRRIYRWRPFLLEPEFIGLDEHGISNAYLMTPVDKLNEKFGWHVAGPVAQRWSRWRKRKLYLVEQYTTPFVPKPWLDGSLNSAQPGEWFYRDGHITNSRDEREFLYLHFMNFKSSRWRHDGTPAPWESLQAVCHASVTDMTAGIVIDGFGIRAAPTA